MRNKWITGVSISLTVVIVIGIFSSWQNSIRHELNQDNKQTYIKKCVDNNLVLSKEKFSRVHKRIDLANDEQRTQHRLLNNKVDSLNKNMNIIGLDIIELKTYVKILIKQNHLATK
jgi:hypothetical protein